jgi:HK97 family phage portal protein
MSMWSRAARPPQQRAFQGIPQYGNISGYNIPNRTGVGRHGSIVVTDDRAMQHSAVWACLRLRADLMSTFPVDVLRDLDGIPAQMPKPPVLVSPGGQGWSLMQWMWASQRDLDSAGNAIGVIEARNGIQTPYYPDGLPSVIQLADPRNCSVIWWKGKLQYRINGKIYQPRDVYHEKQYPLSGSPVGLSPLLNAARSIGEYLSMQQHSLDWFGSGGVPKAWMKNTVKRLNDTERDGAKGWYHDTIQNGDLMVTGNDWEYNMIQAEQLGLEWLEGRRFGLTEIARFFGVPADLIDAAISGQSVTYANMTQRNLQFLIMNLNAAVIRREEYLTNLLPQPRYVKLNTDALLRMDPEARQAMLRSQLETWQIDLDEARKLDNRPPLTQRQIDKMTGIFGKPLASGRGGPSPNEAEAAPAPPAPAGGAAPSSTPAPGAPKTPATPPVPVKK